MTERAHNFNIALDDVSITSLSFGKEFTHAIEAKQVAAQDAERAKFIVEKAEQDKKSAVIRAQVSLFIYYSNCTVGFVGSDVHSISNIRNIKLLLLWFSSLLSFFSLAAPDICQFLFLVFHQSIWLLCLIR